jgi:hypothetical protein
MPSAAQSKKMIRRRRPLTQRGEKNYNTADINKAFKNWAEKRGIPLMDAATSKRRLTYGKNAGKKFPPTLPVEAPKTVKVRTKKVA